MITDKDHFYDAMMGFLWYWQMYRSTYDDWYKRMAKKRLANARHWFERVLSWRQSAQKGRNENDYSNDI